MEYVQWLGNKKLDSSAEDFLPSLVSLITWGGN